MANGQQEPTVMDWVNEGHARLRGLGLLIDNLMREIVSRDNVIAEKDRVIEALNPPAQTDPAPRAPAVKGRG